MNRLIEQHRQIFSADPLLVGVAPGRVNLIGEHTDYNDGFVFPMAIEQRVQVAASRRSDRKIRLHSLDYEETVEADLGRLVRSATQDWANYPLAVASVLLGEGHPLSGFELTLEGNIPQGSGLSSSAALEVASGLALQGLFGLEIPGVKLAQLAQRAESEFVGVHCGIMDQFVSRLAEPGAALLLDCRTLDYRQVALQLRDACIAVTNTNKPRQLAASAYNERRSECQAGVEKLKRLHPGTALRDYTLEDLRAISSQVSPVVRKRCQHVIGENRRVLQAERALLGGDLAEFGRLMNASHESLRDLYQVSCDELDYLVELAWDCPGVYGARMTGAGFGGCTVTLLETASVPAYQQAISGYQKRFGRSAELLLTLPSQGAHLVRL